jgi:hypothetical protein
MVDAFTKENIILNIVSIIIAALIVRIIYGWFDVLITGVEQCFDEDYRDEYLKTTNHLASAVMITVFCGFLIIVIYQWWIHHGMHLNR